MSLAANRAEMREQAKGKNRLKLVGGTTVVADTNPLAVVSGLREVVYVVASCSAGGTANAAVCVKTAGSGTFTLEGAAAGTYDWLAYGY